jgi:hypothetical protein
MTILALNILIEFIAKHSTQAKTNKGEENGKNKETTYKI